MRDEQGHLALSQLIKALENFVLGAGVESGGGLIENQHLCLTQVSPRESKFLPFAAGKVYATFKPAPQHLIVSPCEALDHAVSQTFFCCFPDTLFFRAIVDTANRDILSRRHLVAHEVLEDDANLSREIFEIVLAEIRSIKQDAPGSRIVQAGDQFYDGCLALTVLADQSNTLARFEPEVQTIEDLAVCPRIDKRNVLEFEAAHGWAEVQARRPALT